MILNMATQIREVLGDHHDPLDLYELTAEMTRRITDDEVSWRPPVSEDDLARVRWLHVAQVLAVLKPKTPYDLSRFQVPQMDPAVCVQQDGHLWEPADHRPPVLYWHFRGRDVAVQAVPCERCSEVEHRAYDCDTLKRVEDYHHEEATFVGERQLPGRTQEAP